MTAAGSQPRRPQGELRVASDPDGTSGLVNRVSGWNAHL